MRAAVLLLSMVLLWSCRPSATVVRTTPVANLQPYRTLLVRASDASRVSGHLIPTLEQSTATRISEKCAFTQVVTPQHGNQPVDVVLDLNLVSAQRGSSGLIQNPNVATVNVTLVLSDVINDELLGSADIKGRSPSVAISTALPEHQAIGAVADSITDIMKKSGCVGPRTQLVATKQPNAPQAPASPSVDPNKKKQAESYNDQGKKLFRAANVAGAKQQFQAAIAIDNDPRYVFNLCLAEEALHEYQAATQSCQAVKSMAAGTPLAEKAQLRLDIIAGNG